jgi:NADH-quinone oxidoreductase subunit M
VDNEKNAALPDLSPREWAVLVPVLAAVVLMGVLPNLFLRPIGPAVSRTLNQIQAEAPSRIRAGRDDGGANRPVHRVSLPAGPGASGASGTLLIQQPALIR